MRFVDETNKQFYEDLWRQDRLMHRYPTVNTVRCERMFFRKHGAAQLGKVLDYGFGSGQEAIYQGIVTASGTASPSRVAGSSIQWSAKTTRLSRKESVWWTAFIWLSMK